LSANDPSTSLAMSQQMSSNFRFPTHPDMDANIQQLRKSIHIHLSLSLSAHTKPIYRFAICGQSKFRPRVSIDSIPLTRQRCDGRTIIQFLCPSYYFFVVVDAI
jgi:hypothetical protein